MVLVGSVKTGAALPVGVVEAELVFRFVESGTFVDLQGYDVLLLIPLLLGAAVLEEPLEVPILVSASFFGLSILFLVLS